MANYKTIVELRPEMADFFRNQRLIAVRGDVLCYGPNIRCDSFSTDEAGFRHSTFGGRHYSVADCIRSDRYGLVLGASNLFGFGIAGNENAMASLLAERFGFPFANAAMPGATSRNLDALLVGLIAAAGHPPAVVVISNGADLANFCETATADPIFGSPNRPLLKSLLGSASVDRDADQGYPNLLAFTSLWTSALAMVCRTYKTPLVLIHQSTFFEKKKPTKLELDCGLGEPFNAGQEQQFANHRKFDQRFYDKRKAIADALGVPLAGWGMRDEIGFMDEFHADAEGIRLMTAAVAEEIAPLLDAKAAAPKAKTPAL